MRTRLAYFHDATRLLRGCGALGERRVVEGDVHVQSCGDEAIIDGSLNGVALRIIPFFTRLAGRAQSGYVFTYAFAMVLGVAALITWVSIAGASH